jgi:hypothetical protein
MQRVLFCIDAHHPHNVGPIKTADIRPKKAWEIHTIRAFIFSHG